MRQYLATLMGSANSETNITNAPNAATSSAKVALAAKRAMRSLQRAIGSKGLGRKGLAQITNELLADEETVEIAQQIKPLVDALAAAGRKRNG